MSVTPPLPPESRARHLLLAVASLLLAACNVMMAYLVGLSIAFGGGPAALAWRLLLLSFVLALALAGWRLAKPLPRVPWSRQRLVWVARTLHLFAAAYLVWGFTFGMT